MSLMSAMDISTSGLSCERKRMEIIAQNMANIETTQTSGGGPYRRKVVVFKEVLQQELQDGNGSDFTGGGVEVAGVIEDKADPLMVYEPQHPDANEEGYVAKPDLNLADEIVDSISASRAYAGNVTVLNMTKSLALKALTIGRG